MNINKKELPKAQLELTIEISLEELKPYLEKAAQDLSQEKPIKGFRPGKASFEVVKQTYGEMAILQKANNAVISETFYKAMEQEKIEIVDQPKIEVIKSAPDNPFIYKATVSLLPKVELCDYANLKIKQTPEIKIEDKEVDKVIEDLREMRAKEVLADKKIEKEDKVEVDFATSVDGVAIDGGTAKKYPLVIGSNQMIPGFEDNLIGLKKDEEKEFEIKFPKNYHKKDLQDKPAKFKIKVLAVYSRELPELNDELGKMLGLKDLESLKNRIKEDLKKEKETKESQKQEIELLEKIIDKSTFAELPDVLVNSEIGKMIQEYKHNIEKQGLKFEDYLKQIAKTEAELKIDFAKDALKRVKTGLIIREVAIKEKISATKEEVQQEIDKQINMYKLQGLPEEQIKAIQNQIDTDQYRYYTGNIITNRKTIQKLKDLMVK